MRCLNGRPGRRGGRGDRLDDRAQADPTNPWRYAGGALDSTGLYHFGARYYDPAIGRWTQQDSIVSLGDPANANRYAYAGDDPVNFVDPSGYGFFKDVGATVGGAVAVVGFCGATGGLGCAALAGFAGAGIGGAIGFNLDDPNHNKGNASLSDQAVKTLKEGGEAAIVGAAGGAVGAYFLPK